MKANLILALLLRYSVALGFWVLLAGTATADLVAGCIVAGLATAVSVRLMRPRPGQRDLLAALQLVLSFLWQSLVSGFDISWRVLHPKLPLHPGLVRYPTQLPPGTLRSSFAALTGAIPGALPVGAEADGSLIYHCLDTTAPLLEQLQRDEERIRRAAGLVAAQSTLTQKR